MSESEMSAIITLLYLPTIGILLYYLYMSSYCVSYMSISSTGNVMNGPIGKQMVDTLVESSQNFEVNTNKRMIDMLVSC